MKRTGWTVGLRIAGLVLALGALGIGPQARPAAAAGSYTYDFEQDLKPWEEGTGSLVTLDPNDNRCPLNGGTSMARLTIPVLGSAPAADPDRFGNDLAYMRAAFPAGPGDTVTVDWAAKPAADCPGECLPIVYAGAQADPPLAAFVTVTGTPGGNGWTNYRFVTSVPASATDRGQIYLALGVSLTQHLFPAALGIDCVRMTIVSTSD